jgi:hypothetical protein
MISKDNPGTTFKMNLEGLRSGIYLIRLDLKDDVFLKKIIHQ